ncbi:hypothetical protein ACFY71_37375 [Streptomyces cinerochromogenes]|uniref:hypothetical protein n=1 Tax=Streptomyces cinerochromogenes TaxID=66422 RepID=UPI0036B4C160
MAQSADTAQARSASAWAISAVNTRAPATFRRWAGEYGSMPGARISLSDEEAGEVLDTWPDDR